MANSRPRPTPFPVVFRRRRQRNERRDARQTALAEWHGVDLAPLEKAQRVAAQPLANLIPQVWEELGLERRRSETEILRAWQQLIDPVVTAHAQPAGFRNGTLFVTVDSHVWLDEILRYRRREILTRLQHCFGSQTVKRLSIRVG